jgi:hypothetical protein
MAGPCEAHSGVHRGAPDVGFPRSSRPLLRPDRGRAILSSIAICLPARARRRDGVRPPLHRRDLQRRSLPRIDPADRGAPARPLEYVRVAAAVRYLKRDVFIKRSGLDRIPAIVARRPHSIFPDSERYRLAVDMHQPPLLQWPTPRRRWPAVIDAMTAGLVWYASQSQRSRCTQRRTFPR